MASTSSSTNTLRYDVFLSFRGEDTRYSFTDHLYKALVGAGLRTFRAKDTIQLGQKMKPEIKDAIIGSRSSVVVLSENYAKSRWCLDELLLILEQKRKRTHFVLPVFYRVDPSDVKQGRSFSIQGSTWTVDNTTRWNEALREVADLKGMVLSGYEIYETDFIKEVVETVKNLLDLKQLSTPVHITEMEGVNSQLDLKQLNTPAHLSGMGTVNNQLDLKQLSTPAHLTGTETVNSQLDLQPSVLQMLNKFPTMFLFVLILNLLVFWKVIEFIWTERTSLSTLIFVLASLCVSLYVIKQQG